MARKKFEDRRAEILKAARELFEGKGYDKTAIQDVMDVLGISKGTVYHYFSSKEELFEAVVEEMVERSCKEIQVLVKRLEGSALEKMEAAIEAGSIAEENQGVLESLHQPVNSAMHCRLLAKVVVKQAPLYAELIRQGCKEGTFTTGSPLECAEFILAGIQFLTDMGIHAWTEQDLHRRIQSFPGLVERMLQAPAGSFRFLARQMGG